MGFLNIFKNKKKKETVQSSSSAEQGKSHKVETQPVTEPNPLPRANSDSLKDNSFAARQSFTSHPNNNNIKDNASIPGELLPIVTLINHQQSRCYAEIPVQIPSNHSDFISDPNSVINWIDADIQLNGTDLAMNINDNPVFINIVDCELAYYKDQNLINIVITNNSCFWVRLYNTDDLNFLYSSLLLSQYEFKQLQESFTGALLSSKAIYFSDIRTLLDPKNKHNKEEWCVLRFPFLNDKWIRCYVVTKFDSNKGKIEIYISSNKSKKNLLATITNGKTCFTIYPDDSKLIDTNSLIRLWADCFINVDLLNIVINDDLVPKPRSRSASKSGSKSRTNSLTKRLSSNSLRSLRSRDSNTNLSTQKQHNRISSIDSNLSSSSFTSKTPKKLVKKNLVKTHLCYLIPESHAGVSPAEIMLRMIIPVMNVFCLYGRPNKFVSSRNETDSLLFGLPQLPHTTYLDSQSAYDLACINIENSLKEDWSLFDWSQVFKELISVMMANGWTGGSIQDLNLTYKKTSDIEYDPNEDFNDPGSSDSLRVSSLNSTV